MRLQDRRRDGEIADQPGRDRAAARLGATLAVEEQDPLSCHRQFCAAVAPAGPPPTTTTSKSGRSIAECVIIPPPEVRGRCRRPLGWHVSVPWRSRVRLPPRPGRLGPPAGRRFHRQSGQNRTARIKSTPTVPTNPPRPNATAGAAPQRSIRSPVFADRRARKRHHRPNSGDRENAVREPRATTFASAAMPAPTCELASRQCRARQQAAATVKYFRIDGMRPRQPAAGDTDQDHAAKHAAILKPGELGGLARRHLEGQACKRLQYEILHAVGEHRYEDEDGEQSRLRVAPCVGKAFTKRCRRRRPPPRVRQPRFSMPATARIVSARAASPVMPVTSRAAASKTDRGTCRRRRR